MLNLLKTIDNEFIKLIVSQYEAKIISKNELARVAITVITQENELLKARLKDMTRNSKRSSRLINNELGREYLKTNQDDIINLYDELILNVFLSRN